MNYSGGSEVVTQLQWCEKIKDDPTRGEEFWVQRLRATATCAFVGSETTLANATRWRLAGAVLVSQARATRKIRLMIDSDGPSRSSRSL